MSWAAWIERNRDGLGDIDSDVRKWMAFAEFIGVTGKNKRPDLVTLRWLICEDMMKELGFSVSKVARLLKYNHSTFLHGMRKLEELRSVRDEYLLFWEAFYLGKKPQFERQYIDSLDES